MEGRKSKPLSDITNSFGVTPIAALVEFLASTSNTKSLTPKDNISSANEKLCSGSSKRSESSIGSSSVAASRLQLGDPSTIEVSSIKTRSGGGNKDAARSTQKLIEKTGNIKGNDVVIVNNPQLKARQDTPPMGIAPPFAEEIKGSDHCLKEREHEKSVTDSCSTRVANSCSRADPTGRGKGDKRKKIEMIGSSSCPMVKNRHEVKGRGDKFFNKSWTNPRPNASKKRCLETLEFIEKQKAYFREVDEFQLDEEEEASHDELGQ
ncbi:hypothetical protein M569_03343 [Genlisea aurea]|uniref:Uncharacterized protein n=1 Tax=Genlisea aurea TaxID=192259 RepID=S8D233_9LAMI|nr:hypothetical protein M569_03343 [Genlisea aurea]